MCVIVIFSILTGVCVTLSIVACLALVFSDELIEYLKAKTEELKAMTELIRRKEKTDEHSGEKS